MIESPRARQNLEKLLKLARATADALSVDLADIEAAQETAQRSLTGLEELARREEAQMRENEAVDFAAYIDSMRERRLNLQTTLMTLGDAEDETRDKLEAALIEMRKLEHLIAVNERKTEKTAVSAQVRASEAALSQRRVS